MVVITKWSNIVFLIIIPISYQINIQFHTLLKRKIKRFVFYIYFSNSPAKMSGS